MKRVDQYNNTYNKHIKVSMVLAVSIFLTLVLIYFPIYINELMTDIKKEAIVTLQNVADQNKTILQNFIQDKQKTFQSLVLRLEKERKYNIQDIIEEFKLYVGIDSLYSMGIIDKNGICYNTLGEELDLSQYDYFKEGMKGNGTITHSYLTEDKKDLINIFTVPIYKDGKVEMLLTATYRSSDFSKQINVDSFNGNGHSVVISLDKGLITAPTNVEKVQLEEYNIDIVKQEIAMNVLEKLSERDKNLIYFDQGGKSYLAYYEPLEINDWYLVSYVPQDYIDGNFDEIRAALYRGSLLIYVTCIALLVVLIREHVQYKKKMTKLIFFDELTGEKNYEYLKLHFDHILEQDKKDKFLVVMDIEKFKTINIIYGSKVGDKILKYIPTIFKELLPNDEIFKYQGDVFVAVMSSTSPKGVIDKINKIQNKIKADSERKLIIPIKLCFGVCALDEFSDLHSIYNNALIAKNSTKKIANRNIEFFNEEDKNRLIINKQIEFDFSDALKTGEFEIWYQPKYNMETEEVYGAEALVRWRKKDGNFVFPSNFIPVLENTGQIIQLDELVIEMVFQDIQEMRNLKYNIKPISINLSRVQITNLKLIDKIKDLMIQYKIDPSYISFEITETALVEDNNLINRLIAKLHELGFKIDIDDYGIGNSTLNSVFSSSFDTLKLDKTFVDNIGNPKMDAIIRSTIKMARELKMTIVAEGVEEKEQVDFLIANNCSIAQGYYFSKPLIKEEYFKLIKK